MIMLHGAIAQRLIMVIVTVLNDILLISITSNHLWMPMLGCT